MLVEQGLIDDAEMQKGIKGLVQQNQKEKDDKTQSWQ